MQKRLYYVAFVDPLHQYPQYILKGIDQIYNCPVEFIAATETDKYHHIIMFLAALK